VTAIAVAGWLFLFVILLIVPPAPGPRRGGRWADPGGGGELGPEGDEPPAVISLLAGKLDRTGFGATLVSLAARGWFQVRGPGEGGGADLAGGPALCVVPAQTPGGALAPFERRVLAHVALRAGAAGQVPAPALADGFEGGEAGFMSAFKEEVDAEARRRGLTRARLSGRRIGLLCLLLFVPVVTVPAAVAAGHQHYWLAWAAGLYVAGAALAGGVGNSRRLTAAGRAALKRWRSAVAAAPGDGRAAGYAAASAGGRVTPFAATTGEGQMAAYAAALGGAPGALAVFAPGRKNTAWTSYRGGWQQLEIETGTWSWQRGCLAPLAILTGAVLYVAVAVWAGTHGLAGLAKAMAGLVLAGAVAGGLAWLAHRATPPPFAEFDGQVIRQWIVKGDSDSPDEYRVAVDDGTRETAWDFGIGSERYRRLTPGTFVHVRVNLRNRADLAVAPVEPPPVARPLAAVAADQERAATRGLPDPEDLVTRDEAAAVIGGPASGKHLDGGHVDGWHLNGGPGRSMVWQHAKTTRPMLRVEIRYAADARPVPPGAWRVPGVADGYLTGQAAGVIVPPLITILSVHGTVPAGPARLTALLPVVEGRLRELATRRNWPAG
jgi:hypothetical protein